jgi:hypothetical protein
METARIVYPTKVMRIPLPLVAVVEGAIARLHDRSAVVVEEAARECASNISLEPEEARAS